AKLHHEEGSTITFSGGTITITDAQALGTGNIRFRAGSGGQAGTLTVSSVLAGTGGIMIDRNAVDSNVLIVGNSGNTFAGDLVVRNVNTIRWGAANVVPDGNNLICEVAGGNFAATFDLNGNNETVKSVS